MKVYGSPLCPDCRECEVNFDANQVEYEYIDITASMANLKEFLKLRDHEAVFEAAKENGSVGIPAICSDEGITLDWEGWLTSHDKQVVYHENGEVKACSIDGKGC